MEGSFNAYPSHGYLEGYQYQTAPHQPYVPPQATHQRLTRHQLAQQQLQQQQALAAAQAQAQAQQVAAAQQLQHLPQQQQLNHSQQQQQQSYYPQHPQQHFPQQYPPQFLQQQQPQQQAPQQHQAYHQSPQVPLQQLQQHQHLQQQQLQQQQQNHHLQKPPPAQQLEHPQQAEPQQKSAVMPSNTQASPPPKPRPAVPAAQVKTKFPVARIKRIMQADEDVGKVAQVTPVIVSKALELFMISLVSKSAEQARVRNSKRITAGHLKQAVVNEEQFDFLADVIAKAPDIPQPSDEAGATGTGDDHEGGEGVKKRGKPRGRRPKAETQQALQQQQQQAGYDDDYNP